MIGTIPRPFIDDLVDRVDIVEVIDHRVKLKKSGKNYAACCPFHDEKSPSFTVSPDKQFYYCFGCGATGNAIGFLMEYERLSFPDAIENLAKQVGLDVPRETSTDPKQREREQAKERARKALFTVMEAANDYYQQQLRQHTNKSQAVDYLKRRGLSGQIAKTFGIGYAPPGWDNVAQALASSNEKQDSLLEAGMLIYNEEKDRLYDRFRERIMFPIRDTRGRVIGFGGRVLDDSKPKYLNSPETPIFSKGKELYGLYEAREAYKQLPRLLVVEGYMDVVALAQYGIRYGVATLGTACGEEHLKRAFRYTNEVVFCFDGDEAGRKAASRAMENAIPVMEDGRQVKFLYLPDGEDPDSLVREIGAEKFTRLVDGANPLETFLFDTLAQGIDTRTMEGRARLCKAAAPLLNRLPRGVYRELMFQQLANRSELSIDALMTLLQELPAAEASSGGSDPPSSSSQQVYSKPPSQSYTAYGGSSPVNNAESVVSADYHFEQDFSGHLYGDESPPAPLTSDVLVRKPSPKQLASAELALALLLFRPSLAAAIDDVDSLRHSRHEAVMLLVELLDLLHARPTYSSGQIMGYWQGTYGVAKSRYLEDLLGKGALFHHIGELDQEQEPEQHFNHEAELVDAIKHLMILQQQEDCANIIQQLNMKPLHTWSEADKQLYSNAIVAKSPQRE